MRAVLSVLLATICATAAGDELEVDVYDGPEECSDGDRVVDGKYVTVHYIGRIDNSSETGEPWFEFDNSHKRGRAFEFQIGQGQVLPGWEQGLIGLCEGASLEMVVPPELAYGRNGKGQKTGIPGYATLHFDLEIVSVRSSASPPPNVFRELDGDLDQRLTKDEVSA
jgi:FKBP-type peptidyl-prolyl cis-trans isomerase